MDPATYGENDLPVCAIAKGHGLKGEVKLRLYSRETGILQVGQTLRGIDSTGQAHALELSSLRTQGQKLVAGFVGIETRTQADELRGMELALRAEDIPQPAPGKYFLSSLIGYTVVAESGEVIGPVQDTWEFPANDVLQVEYAGGEALIPLIDDVVKQIDHADRRILITVIDGLLE